MPQDLFIRRAAVLGAGVMGAQIAAHLVNAGVDVVLYELPAEGNDPNANVNKAIAGLRKAQPSPLATPEVAGLITPANYKTDLEKLGDCDLIIEAIAERMDWKRDLYAKIAPHVRPEAILASNTSGLSINGLAEVLPEQLRPNFCGVHFFNPPRYMALVELIPCRDTRPEVLDQLETFLVTTVGKGVVRAKDTPNFIANRIGVFSMVAAMYHAERFGIPFDVVDQLTGPAIGRPKSATFRTADVVGLDTFRHVVNGSAPSLADDPWQQYLQLPAWLDGLIEKGALGQKTRAGIFRKDKSGIQVFDPAAGDYRPAEGKADPAVKEILKLRDPAEKFAALRASDNPQAQFLWAIHRDAFHYAAYLLEQIADNARDVDFAIRWGFGWQVGPLETWQSAGWKQVAQWIDEDIKTGKAMAQAELPAWVHKIEAVHTPQGSYAPAEDTYRPRSQLSVYQRQLFPETLLGEARPAQGETVFETDAVRLWTLDNEIGILSFRSKMHAVGADVLEGVQQAMDVAEPRFRAVVLWQPSEPFSAGANLGQVAEALQAGDYDTLDRMVANFQAATGRMRDSRLPTVAAVRGLALGGGCEFPMHCDRVVASLESYMGLVEAGVGLIPAGGGCKEFAIRAAAQAPDGDPFPFIKNAFETIAMAKVAKSAREAQQLGLLRPSDLIILNPHEVLFVAIQQAKALADSAYRPPLKRKVRVAGRNGIATLKTMLANMREGGFISAYDFEVASFAATALCGGDVESGLEVDEKWLLDLERRFFVHLLKQEKTHERIGHMLKTGKPLRN